MTRTLRIAIGLPVLFGALDLTVISAALPVIISELDLVMPAGARQVAWLVTGYLLAYAIGILIAGRLSDIIGERRVLVASILLFGFASILMAVSGEWSVNLVRGLAYRIAEARPDPGLVTLYILIAARALQALGAGAIVPVGMAAGWRITGRASWFGFIAAVDMAGWTLGHLYGGIIVRFSNWRWAFWINVPLVLIALWSLRSVPDRREHDPSTMPYLAVALAAAGLIATLIGLGGDGQAQLQPGWIAAGLALLVLSVPAGASQLLPIDVAAHQPIASIANVMLGFSVFLTLAMVPLFITTLIESDSTTAAWTTGWMLTLYTAPLVMGAWLGSRWRRIVLAGAVGVWIGFAMVRTWDLTYASMSPSLVVLGLSIGTFFAPIAEDMVSAVSPKQAGGASSFVILGRLIGMSLGTAVLTQTVTATFVESRDLADALLPAFHGASSLGWWGAAALTMYALTCMRQSTH